MPELLIGKIDVSGIYQGMFYDLYTVIDETVAHILSSGERGSILFMHGFNICAIERFSETIDTNNKVHRQAGTLIVECVKKSL